MVIKPKALHVPWPILLFHRPVQASYHRLCSGHRLVSMLIDRVHLALLILKQNLLPVYCFTIKKARLIIIKRKAFSNHTFFCTFAAPLLHFFLSIFLYAYIFALKATNFAIIFPPTSSFIRPITLLFFSMGHGLFPSFEYPPVSKLFSTPFAISL